MVRDAILMTAMCVLHKVNQTGWYHLMSLARSATT